MKRPRDPRTKELVVRIDSLDGVEVHRTNPLRRYVYHRPNGRHYIVTFGFYKHVEPDGEGGFIERQEGVTMNGGIAV